LQQANKRRKKGEDIFSTTVVALLSIPSTPATSCCNPEHVRTGTGSLLGPARCPLRTRQAYGHAMSPWSRHVAGARGLGTRKTTSALSSPPGLHLPPETSGCWKQSLCCFGRIGQEPRSEHAAGWSLPLPRSLASWPWRASTTPHTDRDFARCVCPRRTCPVVAL
jgi:hypothetical protein